MRRSLKRIIGLVAVLIGASGTAFSGVAAVQSWTMADRLGREIPAAVADLERVVESVRRQGDATLSLIDAARDRIRFVGETVDDLSDRTDRRSDPAAILEALDPDIEQRLEAAESFILAMQESLRSLNRAMMLIDSVPLFSRRFAPGAGGADRPLNSVAASLAEAVELLDEATRTLDRIRSGQAISPRQLDQFRDLLEEVDRSLLDVRDQFGTFFASVELAGDRLSRLRSAAPAWIDRASVVATCFFACFGASQLSLLAHGWKLMT